MEILTMTYNPALSPSSMDPRPPAPDDPQVTLTLPGSPPGPGVSADDAAKPEQLAIGWPPRLPRQPGEALPAPAPGWQYTPSARAPDLPPQPAGQPRDTLGRWVEL
jgi:hypothetical protein